MPETLVTTSTAVPGPTPLRSRLKGALDSQPGVLLGVIVLLAVAIQLAHPVFLSPDNVITLLRSAVTTFIIGAAAAVVFTSGGIDLSVGAVFNLGGMVTALALVAGVPWPFAIIVGIVAGGLIGLVNAALVILARVPAIIATLASFYAVGGVSIILTNGSAIAPLPKDFTVLGQGAVGGQGGLPFLILYAVGVGILFHLLLAETRFGYDVRAVGGNEFAALANGVAVRRIKSAAYILSGGAAALAGILYAARTGTGDPQAGGADLTFGVITAVLIGGTSLFGGIGTVAGTAVGALLFAVIQNGLTITGVNPIYSNVIIGFILAAAVALDSWRRSRAFVIGRGR